MTSEPAPPPPPRDRASCVDHPFLGPDDWFGDPKTPPTSTARTVCLYDCPVRSECLDYSLAQNPTPLGVWAGLSPRERDILRRKRAARLAPARVGAFTS